MMDYKGLMVFAEQQNGKIHPVSFELLGKGRELAGKLGVEVSAVLLGYGIEAAAQELVWYGADKVFVFDNPTLADFDLLNYKHNINRSEKSGRRLSFSGRPIWDVRLGRVSPPPWIPG
jgi:electron transfer flavoprotein alpha subunit